jgi:valyl-tRNA synthetase
MEEIQEWVILAKKLIKSQNKEIERLNSQIEGINKKLSNKTFVSKAPPKVIEIERKKMSDMTEMLNKLNENLNNLRKS